MRQCRYWNRSNEQCWKNSAVGRKELWKFWVETLPEVLMQGFNLKYWLLLPPPQQILLKLLGPSSRSFIGTDYSICRILCLNKENLGYSVTNGNLTGDVNKSFAYYLIRNLHTEITCPSYWDGHPHFASGTCSRPHNSKFSFPSAESHVELSLSSIGSLIWIWTEFCKSVFISLL